MGTMPSEYRADSRPLLDGFSNRRARVYWLAVYIVPLRFHMNQVNQGSFTDYCRWDCLF